MGKRLISQRRGRGTPTYRSASHRFKGKIKYRAYDSIESEGSLKGKVVDIMHDPGRTAPVARVKFENGEERLILAPEALMLNEEVECGVKARVKPGNSLPLSEIPEGTPIYNIENRPGDGGKLVRSSGTYASLITHDADKAVIELPSGELKALNPQCRATVGVVAGGGRREKPFLKAGKKYHALRAKGKKSVTVRGVAMNAVDHPHGGGNRQHPGRPTTVSRHAPPGRKVGSIAARRTGKRR
ncbi:MULTISPECIES: 50S ribosomal protein L2 [Methanothermobacter]|jgi:large subunit ribosomal protein L2|uniref:Large ribosomal subunit protein uL2 n=3 Tax=Methanothermobacter TaxID=145260 RepID=RL2_METTH|nr:MULTISPECIES: 50S ribosomal protein L2 [Methanothermobacter]O26113.1 RecName: Full=Large ribosomal subunit protein uL2; AltName: Full=50S ribosomal protein L2 [Methanothermobacter thermautotrophicus str. Delta H]MBC7110717.1 50S ribosomal protein L2 [Methanothermobacter sp.]AAB84525.1 ribosomal protein L8 (E.coli) [Methanothermobacter thermautotrophicus str. Delta H]MDK2874649.1 large subunit ribosomal protein [Methanothermobacter sp.]MDN5374109.1 large subunit ribosomal protein [Methanothe